jgi:release factor glutamine methyltransferase
MNTTSLPTTSEWLKDSTRLLNRAGIATARLDCLVLLEDITAVNRAILLAKPDSILQVRDLKKLNTQIEQRISHTPLAYIRGRTEFYGRVFQINHSVLEPRPESETMIEMLKQLLINKNTIIVDIGCGSGALAITAKLEIPKTHVIATDIDPNCLKTTAKNAKKLRATIELQLGNLLDPMFNLNFSQLILLCNLPYVPNSFQINPAALQEPRHAIFGGPDGLDIYRQLFTQLQDFRGTPVTILTECMPPQHYTLAEIAKGYGFQLQKSEDFIQLFWRA